MGFMRAVALGRGLVGALGPLFGLAAAVAFFAVADRLQADGGAFASRRNFQVILVQTATVAVASLGMTLVIIAGGIDLSAGTAVALCATVLAWLLRAGHSPPLALAGCVLAGALCGLLNGALIGVLGIPPFIATLGAMTAYLGLAKIIAGETTVRPALDLVPGWLGTLVSTQSRQLLLGLPPGVWLALVFTALLWVVLRYHRFGRHVTAVGSNEATARLCGLCVPCIKIAVYTLGGVFFGLAGVYQFSRLSVGNPTSGLGLELRMIAAVVIGGGSLSGGQGSAWGTVLGAAFMTVVASGCNALRLSNPMQDIAIGVIVVAAVAADRLRQWRRAA
jgi:ribose/xylose/arabinose/galactoside ABC-type transport system permease subunit